METPSQISPAITPVLNSVEITANSAPTDIDLIPAFVPENLPSGTKVGTFEAVDVDGGTRSFVLVGGTGSDDNAEFFIEGSDLKTNAIFDFETKSSYTIRVRASDDQGGEFEEQLSVDVANVNDPPTNVILSSNTVQENSPPGTLIGNLSAVDEDAGDSHTFMFTGGVDNALFAIDGAELRDGRVAASCW